jgi:hypothetical protein
MTTLAEGLMSDIKSLLKRVSNLETRRIPAWVYLTTPLTSTSFDGDSFSTTAKTLIDLSSVFSAPAGIKAILVSTTINDSGSAASTTGCFLVLSQNSTANSGFYNRASGLANDAWTTGIMIVPCDVNGDIYYQINASGASTLDVRIVIWGYLI